MPKIRHPQCTYKYIFSALSLLNIYQHANIYQLARVAKGIQLLPTRRPFGEEANKREWCEVRIADCCGAFHAASTRQHTKMGIFCCLGVWCEISQRRCQNAKALFWKCTTAASEKDVESTRRVSSCFRLCEKQNRQLLASKREVALCESILISRSDALVTDFHTLSACALPPASFKLPNFYTNTHTKMHARTPERAISIIWTL